MGSAQTKKTGETPHRETARRVLGVESSAVAALVDRLNESFDRAVELIVGSKGRVVVSGMGKSGIICQKLAATFSSTGTPALFLHPAEAIHGDLGMIVSGDVLLVISNSGRDARRSSGCSSSCAGSGHASSPSRATWIRPWRVMRTSHLHVGVDQEACSLDLVPTASTCAADGHGRCAGSRLLRDARFHLGGLCALPPGWSPRDASCDWSAP